VLRTAKQSSFEYNKYLVGIELDDTDAKVLYTTVYRHAAPVALNLLTNEIASQYLPFSDGQTLTTYNYPIEGVVQYSERFIKLNTISISNQSAVLLKHLSNESYRLVRNLVHPDKLEERTYSELVKVFNGHFTPKRSTFADRAKFYEAIKSDGETIEEWAARLRG
ncbi:putative ATP-binding cassette sub-family A member 3, partial [Operophtera brumata]